MLGRDVVVAHVVPASSFLWPHRVAGVPMDEHARDADAVVDLVTDALRAMDDGGSIYEVICTRLSRIFRASAAAYVQIDVRRRVGTVRCWPSTVDVGGLRRLTERVPVTHPVVRYHLDGNAEPTCLSAQLADRGDRVRSLRGSGVVGPAGCADIADLPLTCTPDQLRLVAFAREADFTAAELDLLRRLHRPIIALDAHLQHLRAVRIPGATPVHDDGPDPVRVAAGYGVTPRELEVLVLLAEGLLATSIAARLRVSPRTVHKHLGSLYSKLETHDRLLAVHRARSLGLVPVPA